MTGDRQVELGCTDLQYAVQKLTQTPWYLALEFLYNLFCLHSCMSTFRLFFLLYIFFIIRCFVLQSHEHFAVSPCLTNQKVTFGQKKLNQS